MVTVAFDGNGHGAAVAPQSFVSGGTVSKPSNPSAAGFVFNGWFSDAALTTPVDFAAAVTASTTYFASWSAVVPAVETVTVSFNTGGHGGGIAPQSFDKGDQAVKPANPTADGFVFDGWFTDAALTKSADFSAPVTASTTFYAKWSAVAAETVTITFNIGGHGSGITPQSFVVGGTVAQPADPTADGFIFNGWFTDAALTKRADFSAPITEATTFYASWSAVATPTPTPTPSPTPIPTTKPSVAPVPPKADAPLAKTGATLDPSAASLALAALGLGAGLLALRARRVRKAD
jgi:uncharacterized repeat protein (TIGR02543 family)